MFMHKSVLLRLSCRNMQDCSQLTDTMISSPFQQGPTIFERVIDYLDLMKIRHHIMTGTCDQSHWLAAA